MTNDSNEIILTRILEAGEGYISGNKLAEELGMSRVGVWARLEKLREQGFVFDAVRHRGYRLVKEPEVLCAPWLKAILSQTCANVPDIMVYPELDSTNEEAMRQLADARDTPFAVLCEEQTKGRGRMGRTWHSPSEGNIYVSLVFRPGIPPSALQGITPWIGLVLARTTSEFTGLPVQIKWPNDLLIDGRKLGGILMEARVDADSTRELVLGFGLNVNSRPEGWQDSASKIATSLAEHGETIAVNRLAARVICAIISAVDDFVQQQHKEEFLSLWPEFDTLAGNPVTVNMGERREALEGIARGINEQGELILELPNGEHKPLKVGEVSIGTARMLG